MGISAIRGIVAPGLAWAALTAAAFGQSKLDLGIEQTLSEIGNARVLVMMAAPKLGEVSSAAYSEPAGFVAGLLGERGRHVQRIVDLPVVVVETDRQGIAALVDNPHVAYVASDEPAPPLLRTSLKTLRIDEVHSTGMFGDGYSIAVLDTGVNYDHPFFGGKLRAEGCFSTVASDLHSVTSLCDNGLDVDLTPGAGRNCDLPGCDHGTPACISAAITVGASLKGTVALDSQYSNTSAIVDFLAPGTEIVSAIAGGYAPKTGTSMAAPHVAGLFALLRSRVPSASADGIESALRATAQRTTDPRTGLVLHFPDAQAALAALASSGRQGEPVAGESSAEHLDAASFAGVAGARRIIIQGGADAMTMRAGELAERISGALGSGATVRSLGASTYLAESRTGFSVESLSKLMVALGSGTRLYLDEPVGPGARR